MSVEKAQRKFITMYVYIDVNKEHEMIRKRTKRLLNEKSNR